MTDFWSIESENIKDMEYLSKNIHKPWNFKKLSKNENLDPNIIVNNPDKPWDYKNLSVHPLVTIDTWIDTIHKPWNYRIIKKRFDKS